MTRACTSSIAVGLPVWLKLRGCQSILLWLLAVSLSACSYPTRNVELVDLDPRLGYRWNALAEDTLPETLVVVTASGGGTRATALTLSVLRAMEQLKLPSGLSLADEIDIISSVSGGSVAAGYFALTGTAGFDRLETSFIRRDGIAALVRRGLNPVRLAELATPSLERIDLLIDYFDETLFSKSTFEDLRIRGGRPYLILNAGDMVEGTPFAFTQETFDLICSDLARLKLSVGVAASAAFPGALSPVTLTNYSPCSAQAGLRWPARWVTNAASSDWHDNPSRVRRGRVSMTYALGRNVAAPDGKEFIHLLDGGIADNIAVAEPLRLLSTNDVSPNLFNQIGRGKIRRVVFILINARSAKPSDLNSDIATPGTADMIQSTINAAIDNATFGPFDRIETLLRERFDAAAAGFPEPLATNFRRVKTFFIPVDFDAIADPECRRAFQGIATSWTLPDVEIDALLIAGKALLRSAPKMQNVAAELSVAGLETLPEIDDACRRFASPSST